jgi:hypothetical protein
MFVLRCTRRLLRRLNEPIVPADSVPTPDARLGDWHATEIVVRRKHLALAVCGVTLLPVLLPAAPYKTLGARMVGATGEMLRALGIPEGAVVAQEHSMRDVTLAATNDRRVLGSMNDFIRMLDSYLREPSLTDAALRLAEAPCGPIGMESPDDATRALFSRPTLRLVK